LKHVSMGLFKRSTLSKKSRSDDRIKYGNTETL